MFLDVMRGWRTEIDDLHGYIDDLRGYVVAQGRRTSVKTPFDAKIVELFHGHGVGTLNPDIRNREPLMAVRP